jgi:hypothetical protein
MSAGSQLMSWLGEATFKSQDSLSKSSLLIGYEGSPVDAVKTRERNRR